MIYKLCGTALVVTASLVTALVINYSAKRHLCRLESFTSLIRLIGAQIENFNLPLSEILKRADPVLLSGCGYTEHGGNDFESFSDFVTVCDTLLSENEKKLLNAFSAEVGRSFRDEQIKLCAYYSERLGELYSKAADDYPKKKKMTTTICVCAALALSLLLV